MMTKEFRALVPTSDMNRTLVLDSARVDNQPGLEILVTMGLNNKSENWVVFPSGYGATAYAWSSGTGQWEKVANRVRFDETPNLLGPSGGEHPSGGVVVFSPGEVWPDPSVLRVVVLGKIRNEDGTMGVDVGAYIDVPRPE